MVETSGFQNRFRLMWKARALLRLPAGISEPTVVIAQTGSEAVSNVTKRHWLLRKRQYMRDRKRIGCRQRSVSFLSFFSRHERPLLAGKSLLLCYFSNC